AATKLVGDAQMPGPAGGQLLTGDEPAIEPSIDGALVDTEQLLGLIDGDHDVIMVWGCHRVGLEHSDAVSVTQAAHPAASERQPSTGPTALLGQDGGGRGLGLPA